MYQRCSNRTGIHDTRCNVAVLRYRGTLRFIHRGFNRIANSWKQPWNTLAAWYTVRAAAGYQIHDLKCNRRTDITITMLSTPVGCTQLSSKYAVAVDFSRSIDWEEYNFIKCYINILIANALSTPNNRGPSTYCIWLMVRSTDSQRIRCQHSCERQKWQDTDSMHV